VLITFPCRPCLFLFLLCAAFHLVPFARPFSLSLLPVLFPSPFRTSFFLLAFEKTNFPTKKTAPS
jgi:hypothetical protein